MKTLLIFGATGQVGRQLLAQALVHLQFQAVVAPTRRPLPAVSGGAVRLENPVLAGGLVAAGPLLSC